MKNIKSGKIIVMLCMCIVDIALLPMTIFNSIWAVKNLRTTIPKNNFITKLALISGKTRATINLGILAMLEKLRIIDYDTHMMYYRNYKILKDYLENLLELLED